MIEKINIYLISRWRKVVFALLSLIMYYVVSFFLHPDAYYWKFFFTQPLLDQIIDVTVSLLFCLIISRISIIINSKLNESLPWTEKTLQRAVIQTGLQILCIVLIIAFQVIVSFYVYDMDCENDPLCDFKGLWNWVSASIIIALIISAINTSNYFIESWKKTALDAAEHRLKAAENKRAAAEAELLALKLQIDPHFVFNNLSVLSELILVDQKLGYDYSENFSKVYRYLLVNSKKDIIKLADELKFLRSYIFLIQNRVGSGVSFEIAIDETAQSLYLPPLTLQFLIENALKHNKTIKSDPLKIKIYNSGTDTLVVENERIPIQSAVLSSGLGLSNIMGRYKLLTDRTPEIIKDSHTFKVIIPLIGYEDEDSNYRR